MRGAMSPIPICLHEVVTGNVQRQFYSYIFWLNEEVHHRDSVFYGLYCLLLSSIGSEVQTPFGTFDTTTLMSYSIEDFVMDRSLVQRRSPKK